MWGKGSTPWSDAFVHVADNAVVVILQIIVMGQMIRQDVYKRQPVRFSTFWGFTSTVRREAKRKPITRTNRGKARWVGR